MCLLLWCVCACPGLERGTEYTFRVSAATLNGTGPATEWNTAETFESDLDGNTQPAPGTPLDNFISPHSLIRFTNQY